MARSDHDRRGRRHSDKKCPEARNGGCNYGVTGKYKKAAVRRNRRTARAEIRNHTSY